MPRYTLGKDLEPLADIHSITTCRHTLHHHIFIWTKLPLHLPFSINHCRVDPTSHLLPPFPSPLEQLLSHPCRPWPCLARTPLLAGSALVRRCWTSWQARAATAGFMAAAGLASDMASTTSPAPWQARAPNRDRGRRCRTPSTDPMPHAACPCLCSLAPELVVSSSAAAARIEMRSAVSLPGSASLAKGPGTR